MSYAVYVGAGLTSDGCAYVAGYGDEPSSHWLELAPRTEHPAGSEIEVGVTPQSLMPGVRSMIPQAPVTARHLRVEYSYYRGVPGPLTNGGLNEHGVAVRDVWSPTSERLARMTPAGQRGVNYSDLARIVLERARTAREGAELIGALVERYGDATYGGNSHLIADAGEAWVVIQFAGGQKLWVAERVGEDSIRVSRPGMIAEVPAEYWSHPDYLGSPHLISFAVDQGWYQPARDGSFNANTVYGDGLGRWDGVRWMEAELTARAAGRDRVTLPDMMWAVRTERLTGDSAGYGQVIALPSSDHPDLRVLWHAPVGALAAPLTPFFLGIASIPPEFRRHRYLTAGEDAAYINVLDDELRSSASQRVEATRSAVVIFKRLLYLLAEHHELFLPEVTPVWEAFERKVAYQLASVIEAARALIESGQTDHARNLLTQFSCAQALRGLDLGEILVASMDARSQLLFGIRDEPGWRGPEQIW
ncbi:MAG TPA: C69 family dipeptidase [Gaiellales bacterium]|nr:C69 family dipeptidase [Gaiellales bacterium]